MVKPVVLNFSRGMDSVSSETELPPGFVRKLRNYDIHGPTRIAARDPLSRVVSAPVRAYHSAFEDDDGSALVVGGSDLMRVSPQGETSVVHASVLGADARMSYVRVNGSVYFSNGVDNGAIRDVDRSQSAPWGVPVPTLVATAFETGAGGLAPGGYLIALTATDASGQESGASPIAAIRAHSAGGRIRVTVAVAPVAVRVYCSPPDGDVLFHVDTLLPGETVSTIGVVPRAGKGLPNRYCIPPPPWKHLALHNGRIYGTAGGVLQCTRAMNYALTRPAEDFAMFPARIDCVSAVTGGIFVGGAFGVQFLAGGDFASFAVRKVSDLAPFPGSVRTVDGALFGAGSGPATLWLTRRGWVLGGADGNVSRINDTRMAIPGFSSAQTAFREDKGLRQFITVARGADGQTSAAT